MVARAGGICRVGGRSGVGSVGVVAMSEPATPRWQWDEFRQPGIDYAEEAEAARYDQRMAQLRNVDAENVSVFLFVCLFVCWFVC